MRPLGAVTVLEGASESERIATAMQSMIACVILMRHLLCTAALAMSLRKAASACDT